MNHAQAVGRFIYLSGAAATALLIVEACSDGVSETLIDAGAMLADAGATEAGQALMEAGMSIQDARTEGDAQVDSDTNFKSGSRIQMRVTVQTGADGSQASSQPTPFDTMLNTDCSLSLAADGKIRCLPAPAIDVEGPFFADAQCTQQLVARRPFDSTCLRPFGWKRIGDSCSNAVAYQVFKLNSAYAGDVFILGSGSPASCVQYPPNIVENNSFFRVTEVPATSLVEFTSASHAL